MCIQATAEALSCPKRPDSCSHTELTRKHRLKYLTLICRRSISPTSKGSSRTRCSLIFTSKGHSLSPPICSSIMLTPTRPSSRRLNPIKRAMCNVAASGIKAARRLQHLPRLEGTDLKVFKVPLTNPYLTCTPIGFRT